MEAAASEDPAEPVEAAGTVRPGEPPEAVAPQVRQAVRARAGAAAVPLPEVIIAYQSTEAGGPNEIYIMNVDASAQTRLTNKRLRGH